MKNSRQILFLLLSFFTSYILAQEFSPIKNYTPKIYNGENQNWSISQSANKNIYVANNKGLLEFNGAIWKTYPSPNGAIIRSVAVINSFIYTGSYMDFGYWEKDKFGELNYNSLSDKINTPMLEDEQIWNIIELEHWILFQSLHRIYIYDINDQTFNIIESKTHLPKIHKINESIYFQKLNDGLYQIINGSQVLVSNDPILQNNIIIDIYSLNNQTVILTQEKGFYHLKNGQLKSWNTPSDKTLSKTSVYSSIVTKSGHLLLGTISNGVLHLDPKGNLLENLTQTKGLNNNTVLALFEDMDNNIWMGLDNGISAMNLNSPFKVFNDIRGELGTVYTSAQHRNILYLGTNQGLFYKNKKSNSNFKQIEGTEGQVWNLKVIDETLFCGHNVGTFTISDSTATKIATIPGSWDFRQLPKRPNLILQGNYDGLHILEKRKNNWVYKNKIEGFDNSSRFFEILNENEIFINHEYKGVFKIKTNLNFTKAEKSNLNDTHNATKSSIIKHQDEIILCNKNGVFKYNNQANSFDIDSLYTKELLDNETFVSGKLISTKNKLWAFTEKSIVYFSSGKLNNKPTVAKISLPSISREDFSGFENISELGENKFLIGNSHGYIVMDTEHVKKKNYSILIDQIKTEDKTAKENLVAYKTENEFDYVDNNIEFTYSIPTFEKYTEINYRFKLKGIYDEWSEWNTTPKASFRNLPFGDYTFVVEGKVGNKNTVNQFSYSFIVHRPWYLSNSAIGLYIFILIITIILIHSSYNQYYKKQKKNLIEKNQRELERSQLENEREIMKLRNEKLRHDIDNKNRELAASTMSIIKKNEFLSTVKKELSEVRNNELVKPVIKIIDKNLNQESDWELFQEAFNNADKDFLKKVKIKHPSLTPNDLRLCAYLRLNLSSKEIAPLLNISHKSVEIKRYRLRKKMNLESKDNLIHHILEI